MLLYRRGVTSTRLRLAPRCVSLRTFLYLALPPVSSAINTRAQAHLPLAHGLPPLPDAKPLTAAYGGDVQVTYKQPVETGGDREASLIAAMHDVDAVPQPFHEWDVNHIKGPSVLDCPDGFALTYEKTCVLMDFRPPEESCAYGTFRHSSGNYCVQIDSVPPDRTCPAGFEYFMRGCIRRTQIAPLLTCPAGYTQIEGMCYSVSSVPPKVTCQSGAEVVEHFNATTRQKLIFCKHETSSVPLYSCGENGRLVTSEAAHAVMEQKTGDTLMVSVKLPDCAVQEEAEPSLTCPAGFHLVTATLEAETGKSLIGGSQEKKDGSGNNENDGGSISGRKDSQEGANSKRKSEGKKSSSSKKAAPKANQKKALTSENQTAILIPDQKGPLIDANLPLSFSSARNASTPATRHFVFAKEALNTTENIKVETEVASFRCVKVADYKGRVICDPGYYVDWTGTLAANAAFDLYQGARCLPLPPVAAVPGATAVSDDSSVSLGGVGQQLVLDQTWQEILGPPVGQANILPNQSIPSASLNAGLLFPTVPPAPAGLFNLPTISSHSSTLTPVIPSVQLPNFRDLFGNSSKTSNNSSSLSLPRWVDISAPEWGGPLLPSAAATIEILAVPPPPPPPSQGRIKGIPAHFPVATAAASPSPLDFADVPIPDTPSTATASDNTTIISSELEDANYDPTTTTTISRPMIQFAVDSSHNVGGRRSGSGDSVRRRASRAPIVVDAEALLGIKAASPNRQLTAENEIERRSATDSIPISDQSLEHSSFQSSNTASPQGNFQSALHPHEDALQHSQLQGHAPGLESDARVSSRFLAGRSAALPVTVDSAVAPPDIRNPRIEFDRAACNSHHPLSLLWHDAIISTTATEATKEPSSVEGATFRRMTTHQVKAKIPICREVHSLPPRLGCPAHSRPVCYSNEPVEALIGASVSTTDSDGSNGSEGDDDDEGANLMAKDATESNAENNEETIQRRRMLLASGSSSPFPSPSRRGPRRDPRVKEADMFIPNRGIRASDMPDVGAAMLKQNRLPVSGGGASPQYQQSLPHKSESNIFIPFASENPMRSLTDKIDMAYILGHQQESALRACIQSHHGRPACRMSQTLTQARPVCGRDTQQLALRTMVRVENTTSYPNQHIKVPMCVETFQEHPVLECPFGVGTVGNHSGRCDVLLAQPLSITCPEGYTKSSQERSLVPFPLASSKKILGNRKIATPPLETVVPQAGACELVEYADYQITCPAGYKRERAKNTAATCVAEKLLPPAVICPPGYLPVDSESTGYFTLGNSKACTKQVIVAPTVISYPTEVTPPQGSLAHPITGATATACVLTKDRKLACGVERKYHGVVDFPRQNAFGLEFREKMDHKGRQLLDQYSHTTVHNGARQDTVMTGTFAGQEHNSLPRHPSHVHHHPQPVADP